MNLAEFDYELPAGRIAQRPPAERDGARMLVLDRRAQHWDDRAFRDFPGLLRGDELIVFNNTRVIPARLFGRRAGVRSQPPSKATRREFLHTTIEVLLTREVEPGVWEALVRPGRKMRVGERVVFGDDELEAEIISRGEFGARRLRFLNAADVRGSIERLGHVPLPRYIRREDETADRERYQTVFAKAPGAVAAPTAGLHFTQEILGRIQERGVETCEITLHVGPGTFQPVRTEIIEQHTMHAEHYEIPDDAAKRINSARAAGRPVLAVGTTVVRALEDAARKHGGSGRVVAGPGEAELFLYPGQEFRVVDQMLTNFHLPQSTLLMLVCALAGREFVLEAYRHAIASGYLFYSYGDCMLIR
jgi:S-adenosylmethionine:tRNA ribosyltransferase-isomerase